jgi:drug/metabolite transporter (DMT)-like permease
MSENLNITLLLIAAVFSGFGFIQNKHLREPASDESLGILLALKWSCFAHLLTGVGLIIFHFTKSPWLASLGLLVLPSLIAPVIFAFTLIKILGWRATSQLGFVAWPIAAYFLYRHILGLPDIS